MKRAAILLMALALLVMGFSCNGRQAPAGASGSSSLTANGGKSAGGNGGNSGELDLESYGHVFVNSTGAVDASFTMPTAAPAYGAFPVEISNDTTVPLSLGGTPTGLFMDAADTTLYNGDGAGNNTPVTGLIVDSGATLTLPTNENWTGSVYTSTSLAVANDITINGTLKFAAVSGADDEVWSTNGSLKVNGTVDGSVAGANGLDELYLGGLGGNVIINQGGLVNAAGDVGYDGAGVATGGYGIYLESELNTVNAGTVNANGGSVTTTGGGAGGAGGYIYLVSDYGNCYNSGSLYANGGTGNGGTGGDAGYIELDGAYSNNTLGSNGDIAVSGTLSANGGDAINGNGGGSGSNVIEIETWAMGSVKVNATISANGGNASGTGGGVASVVSGGGYGGDAGWIEIDSYNEYTNNPNPGAILVAGAITSNGGSGYYGGGNGDGLGIYGDDNYDSNYGNAPNVDLYGFGSIYLDGGSAAAGYTGGSASNGRLYLYTYETYSDAVGNWLPGGPIVFQPDLYARGGDVVGAASGDGSVGGQGGYVDIEPNYDEGAGDPDISSPATVGNLYLTGGNNGATGGEGGYLQSYAALINIGNVDANGGTGINTGGNGDYIWLYSYTKTIYPAGGLTDNGGGFTAAGGTAGTNGNIWVDGTQLQ